MESYDPNAKSGKPDENKALGLTEEERQRRQDAMLALKTEFPSLDQSCIIDVLHYNKGNVGTTKEQLKDIADPELTNHYDRYQPRSRGPKPRSNNSEERKKTELEERKHMHLAICFSSLRIQDGECSLYRRRICGIHRGPAQPSTLRSHVVLNRYATKPIIIDPLTVERLGDVMGSIDEGSLSHPLLIGDQTVIYTHVEKVSDRDMSHLCLILCRNNANGEQTSTRIGISPQRDDDDGWEIVPSASSITETDGRIEVPSNAQHRVLQAGQYVVIVIDSETSDDCIFFVAKLEELLIQPEKVRVRTFEGPACGPVRWASADASGSQITLHILRSKYHDPNRTATSGQVLCGPHAEVVFRASEGLPVSDQWRADENENSNINIVHMDMEWPAGAISKIVPLKGRSGTVTGVRVQCCHAVVEAKDRRGGVLWMSRGTWPELDIAAEAERWGLPTDREPKREPAAVYFSYCGDAAVTHQWRPPVPMWLQSLALLPAGNAFPQKRSYAALSALRPDVDTSDVIQEIYLFDVSDPKEIEKGPCFVIRATDPHSQCESGLQLGVCGDEAVWLSMRDVMTAI